MEKPEIRLERILRGACCGDTTTREIGPGELETVDVKKT